MVQESGEGSIGFYFHLFSSFYVIVEWVNLLPSIFRDSLGREEKSGLFQGGFAS